MLAGGVDGLKPQLVQQSNAPQNTKKIAKSKTTKANNKVKQQDKEEKLS
jgi:hypothetical protein